jgi:hypothetical protein
VERRISEAARRLERVEELFAAAKLLPAAARAPFLAREGGDPAIAREVAQLLAHHEAGGTLLDAPARAWLERERGG